jgi:hypothetical protein
VNGLGTERVSRHGFQKLLANLADCGFTHSVRRVLWPLAPIL